MVVMGTVDRSLFLFSLLDSGGIEPCVVCSSADGSYCMSVLTPCELVAFVVFINVICLLVVILQVFMAAA